MAVITINDLQQNCTLDRAAMSSISGAGGAPWVYGWIAPYVPARPSLGPSVNFYQINNFADQIINQYQVVDVNNSAPNANISVALDERSTNLKH